MADEIDEVGVRLSVKDRAKFSSEVKAARKDIDSLGSSAESASRKASASGSGFGMMGRALGGLFSVAKIATGAIGLVGGAAVAVGFKLFKMGEDAQTTRLRFTETFTGVTSQMDAFNRSINQKFGVPTRDLEAATAQFGRLAQAAKLPGPQVATFAQQVTQAGLDLAAFYNKDPSVVFTALSSGLSGLTRPLRQYGIFIEQANIEAKAMEMGLGNSALAAHKATEANQGLLLAQAKQTDAVRKYGSTSQQAAAATLAVEKAQDAIAKATAGSTIKLTDAQKVAIRQTLIQEQMGAATGALTRRVDTAAGQWRIFTGRLKDTGYQIGTALLPLGLSLLRMLNDRGKPILDWLARNAPIWTDRLNRGLSTLNGAVARTLGALGHGSFSGFARELDNTVGAGGRLEGALKRIWGDLSDVWRIITTGVIPAAGIVGGVAVFLAGKLTPLDSILHYLADRGWLVRDALVAVAAVMALNAAASGILIIKDGIHTGLIIAKAIATGGYSAALAASTALEEENAVAGGLVNAVLTSGLVRIGVAVIGWGAHAASVAIDTTGRYAWLAVNVVGGLIAEGYQLAIIAVKWVALGVAMAAQTVVRGAAAAATWLWTAAQWALNIAMDANPVGLLIIAVALLVGGIVLLWMHSKTFRAIVSEAFFFVWHVIMDAFHWVEHNWPLLLAILTGPPGLAVLFIVRNWGTITHVFGEVLDWTKKHWPLLLAILTGPFGMAVYAVIHFRDQLIGAAKEGINFLIRAWNSLHFHVPGVTVGGVHFGNFDIGTPHIPELHAGGVVDMAGVVKIRPDEEAVYLPTGAAVVPLPKNTEQRAMPPTTGNDRPQLIQLLLPDGRVLTEVLIEGLADKQARR